MNLQISNVSWLTQSHYLVRNDKNLHSESHELQNYFTMEEELFNQVRNNIVANHAEVTEGTMMASPGIQLKGKNFAFFYKKSLAVRLGRDFEPESEGIHKYELLNPFKVKPPLKDWFVISFEEANKWPMLAEIALNQMRKELK
tara:strand:- start:17230 stop:17658 length:429 start_codon:yes stop_codon:yes gene_type:complete